MPNINYQDHINHLVNYDHNTPSVLDMALCRRVHEVLKKHYSDHIWMVQPMPKQGVLNIYNALCSQQYGYTVLVKGIEDNNYHAVVEAGGAILERYNQERGRMKLDKILEMPRDFAGRAIHEK